MEKKRVKTRKNRIEMNCESLSFNELFPRFVAAKVAEGVSEKTVDNYNQHWKCIGKHLDLDRPINEITQASWNYYEPRCLHDSSLSLSTHSVLACDIGDVALGYQMFEKACGIDLSNDDPHSSDAGIHAASYGGLWQCVIYGFGGLRMIGGRLRIDPKLPESWNRLAYRFYWQGQQISVEITKDCVSATNETGATPVELELCGKQYSITGSVSA